MSRRVGAIKRVSLEGIQDGWTSDCYAVITLGGYADNIAAGEIVKKGDNIEILKHELDLIKRNLISGKIMVFNDAGEFELSELLPEDVDANKVLSDTLYTEIMGVTADPKDLSISTETLPTPSPSTEQSDSTSNTKTQ